jgi:hypothetical protein
VQTPIFKNVAYFTHLSTFTYQHYSLRHIFVICASLLDYPNALEEVTKIEMGNCLLKFPRRRLQDNGGQFEKFNLSGLYSPRLAALLGINYSERYPPACGGVVHLGFTDASAQIAVLKLQSPEGLRN